MGQERSRTPLIITTFLALAVFSSCKIEEQGLPTGPVATDAVATGTSTPAINSSNTNTGAISGTSGASTVTAPIISDPLPGSTVSDSQPSLTVLNVARQGGETPTYLFQVSSDSDFVTLQAQSNEVPEGASGSTSWIVDRPLEAGRYFWRVRARSGINESPFSSTAELSVGASSSDPSPSPAPPPSPGVGTILSDPLIGGSVGEVAGGQFTSRGWQVTSPGNYIRYEIPPMAEGWVEFDISGLLERNSSDDQFMLFGMWDPSAGDYRANRFRVHLQKLFPNPHNPPWLRLRWIANGEQHDAGSDFIGWVPNRTYHIRLEWGSAGGGNVARVYIDGSPEIVVNYDRTYRPSVHFVELGIAERGESVVGATYSNLRVGN